VEGVKEFPWTSTIREKILRAPFSWSNHLLKAPLLNTIALGIRFQHMNFGGTQTLSSYHSANIRSPSSDLCKQSASSFIHIARYLHIPTFQSNMKCWILQNIPQSL
jgi:hypothetical protein